MFYDLIVIGGGPAGYNACQRAADSKLSVLCFEGNALGGVCLNEGCIPTKSLLYSAKLLDGAKHGDKYGVSAPDVTLDHARVVTRKNKIVKILTSGIKSSLTSRGVEIVKADATIKGFADGLFTVTADGQEYSAKHLLIATGSSPVIPPIPGIDEVQSQGKLLTNREILALNTVPQNLVIVGGGVIGLEMASYFNSAGANVTVVEMLDHIAGETDRELSTLLQKIYAQKGVRFLLSTKAAEFKDGALICENEKDGSFSVPFDYVLMSVGRRANTAGIGLENIGVATERGKIITDEHMSTNVKNVYAAGDVNGVSMLAHTAYREGEVAVNNMLGVPDVMRYDRVPAVIYTNPELSGIGYTEVQAQNAGIEFKLVTMSMRNSGRYLAENEGGNGIFKMLVDKDEHIIGAHVLSNYSSEFIASIAVMMEAQMTLEQAKKVIFPHPTVCEIIREAVFEKKDD